MFILRSLEGISHLLQPVEDAIRLQFLPTLTGRDALNDNERELLALPARLGGLGIPIPTTSTENRHSLHLSAPITYLIVQQSEVLGDVSDQQQAVKASIRFERRNQQKRAASELKNRLPRHLCRAAELASEKGSSNWLTTLSLEAHGFALHKGAFQDAPCLRYGWSPPPPHLPSKCACGSNFNVEHAFNCPTGGFIIIRHNEVRDLLAVLLSEVCHDVSIEPHLQPLSEESFHGSSANIEHGARLDVAAEADGFLGGRCERAFFDVRVFNPHAPSNQTSKIASSYRRHENEKRQVYKQRVREIEPLSFCHAPVELDPQQQSL